MISLYNEGLDYFYQAFYNKALKKFEDVQRLNNNYPELNYYAGLCRAKIAAGEDKESFMQKNFFRIMAVILFIGGLYIFYRWQKTKRENLAQLIFLEIKLLCAEVNIQFAPQLVKPIQNNELKYQHDADSDDEHKHVKGKIK